MRFAGARKAKKPAARIEQREQTVAVQWLRLVLPASATVFHVPNGGYRKPVEGAILKGMGVLAGVPDVVCALSHEGQPLTLWFEFKAPGEKPRQSQLDVHDNLRHHGHLVAVVETLEDCRAALKRWEIPFREVYRAQAA